MAKFDTHKFLYTLYDDGSVEGHKIIYVDRDNKDKEVIIKSITIGASPVSCKVYDENDKRHNIAFIRIKSVYKGDELVWENTDFNMSDVKVIKGHKNKKN